MSKEKFQPISVKPPSSNPLFFAARCFVDLQLATIVKYLRPAMADLRGSILDVGAGESPWRDWLPKTCTYHGIDVSDAGEFGMKPDRPDITYYNGGVMPFEASSYDGVICVEVIEHVPNPDDLMSEIARVLKPGAPLLLTVPWSARLHHLPHDYHRFTRERLRVLIGDHGFEDVTIRERGNDVGAVANKLIVMTMRLVKPANPVDVIWSWPLAVILVLMAGFMTIAAHVSDYLGRGSKEDPLGYFVRATRQ